MRIVSNSFLQLQPRSILSNQASTGEDPKPPKIKLGEFEYPLNVDLFDENGLAEKLLKKFAKVDRSQVRVFIITDKNEPYKSVKYLQTGNPMNPNIYKITDVNKPEDAKNSIIVIQNHSRNQNLAFIRLEEGKIMGFYLRMDLTNQADIEEKQAKDFKGHRGYKYVKYGYPSFDLDILNTNLQA